MDRDAQRHEMTNKLKEAMTNKDYATISKLVRKNKRMISYDENREAELTMNRIWKQEHPEKLRQYKEALKDETYECTVCGKIVKKSNSGHKNTSWHKQFAK